MGWWKIDPATGEPLADCASSLSQPGFVLLNAVPGADATSGDSYFGDTNLDFAGDLARQLRELLAPCRQPSSDELRDLLLLSIAPDDWPDAILQQAFTHLDAFWADLDLAYQDDWDRPANEAEKRWTTEDVVRRYADLSEAVPVQAVPTYGPLESQFAPGDRVWAWWNAPQLDYYVGTVLTVGGVARNSSGQIMQTTDYVVRFDDGDQMHVPPDRIFPLTLPQGLAIEVREPGVNRYLPATIMEASENAIDVRLADGREHQTLTALIRIPGPGVTR